MVREMERRRNAIMNPLSASRNLRLSKDNLHRYILFIFVFLVQPYDCHANPDSEKSRDESFSIPVNLIFYGTVQPLIVCNDSYNDPVMKEKIIENFQLVSERLANQTGIQLHFSNYYPQRPNAKIVTTFYKTFRYEKKKVIDFLLPLIIRDVEKEINPQGIWIALFLTDDIQGYSTPDKQATYIFFNDNPQMDNHLQALLLHELSHSFGAIDIKDEKSLMSGSVFFSIQKKVPLELDAANTEIMKLVYKNLKENHRFSFYLPTATGKNIPEIIAFYKKLLPNSSHPQQIDQDIFMHYCRNFDLANLVNHR